MWARKQENQNSIRFYEYEHTLLVFQVMFLLMKNMVLSCLNFWIMYFFPGRRRRCNRYGVVCLLSQGITTSIINENVLTWFLQATWTERQTLGSFSNDDSDGNENVKNAKGLITKTTTLHVHFTLFWHISLPSFSFSFSKLGCSFWNMASPVDRQKRSIDRITMAWWISHFNEPLKRLRKFLIFTSCSF